MTPFTHMLPHKFMAIYLKSLTHMFTCEETNIDVPLISHTRSPVKKPLQTHIKGNLFSFSHGSMCKKSVTYGPSQGSFRGECVCEGHHFWPITHFSLFSFYNFLEQVIHSYQLSILSPLRKNDDILNRTFYKQVSGQQVFSMLSDSTPLTISQFKIYLDLFLVRVSLV